MNSTNTSQANLQILGDRLRRYRIDYPLTQKQLADISGVSLRCIQRFESGESIQAITLIKLLSALGLSANLDLLVPDVSQRPSAFLPKAKERQRVCAPRKQRNEKGTGTKVTVTFVPVPKLYG